MMELFLITHYLFYNIICKIEPKPCNPRTGSVKAPRRNASGNTIFLGGLPSNFTEIDLRNFFSQYGKVVEVIIKYDQEKQTCRGQLLLS